MLAFWIVKNNYWIGCRFYFYGRAYEGDINKLPKVSVKYSFEGYDFTVSTENSFKYGTSMYVIQEFEPSLTQYESFTFGIFRGCTKSDDFTVKNILLSK